MYARVKQAFREISRLKSKTDGVLINSIALVLIYVYFKDYPTSFLCFNLLSRYSVQAAPVSIAKEQMMYAFFTKLIKDESGVTAIEYGLIAALIAVAAVTIMTTVGTNLTGTFSKVASNL